MADRSGIEWTDATWNPVTGCTEVSPGCDHCYAKTFAERWRGTPGHHFERGFDLTPRPERLDQPLRWRRPRRIFVNSMSDLFHADVPDEYVAEVFAVMGLAPRHTFQLLTKRHGRMRSLLSSPDFARRIRDMTEDTRAGEHLDWPLPNVWLGVSVENQQWADIRIPALLDTPAAVRWISAEPLLGPVELLENRYLRPARCSQCGGAWADSACGPTHALLALDRGIGWVVVGGESGPGARPMHPAWARSIRDQCQAAGVPFLFKQWGAWVGHSWPEASWIRTEPHAWVNEDTGEAVDEATALADVPGGYQGMWRVGKGAAGRVLDGRTWDEYLAVAGA